VFGKGNVTGKPIVDLGITTTAHAKTIEYKEIYRVFEQTGFVLMGNWKSFRL